MPYENQTQEPNVERDQLKGSLQEKLTNFLNKLLEQAGLLLEQAGESLRNLIPSNIPVWPLLPLQKILFMMRRRAKPKDRQQYALARRRTILSETITAT